MTVTITTQQDRSEAIRRLAFCYLCGEALGKKRGVDWNRDHTPPTAFLSGKAASIPMRAHPGCNSEWSVSDERAGQLVSVLIGRAPESRERQRFEATKFIDETTGDALSGITCFGIENDVRRIVCGMHALMYASFLGTDCPRVSLPFPSGFAPDNVPQVDPVPEWHREAVCDLIAVEKGGRIDRVVGEGSEFEFRCTWRPDTGADQWVCVFGLRIHNWSDLGDPRFGKRGCVGFYRSSELPPDASTAPRVLVPFLARDLLDPFG